MSSETVSFARPTPASRNAARSNAQMLDFIFPGHCTPVERIQKGRLLPPAGLHADVQVEVDPDSEQPLHLLPREGADLFQGRALCADDDGLLARALHPDGRVDAGEVRRSSHSSTVTATECGTSWRVTS